MTWTSPYVTANTTCPRNSFFDKSVTYIFFVAVDPPKSVGPQLCRRLLSMILLHDLPSGLPRKLTFGLNILARMNWRLLQLNHLKINLVVLTIIVDRPLLIRLHLPRIRQAPDHWRRVWQNLPDITSLDWATIVVTCRMALTYQTNLREEFLILLTIWLLTTMLLYPLLGKGTSTILCHLLD